MRIMIYLKIALKTFLHMYALEKPLLRAQVLLHTRVLWLKPSTLYTFKKNEKYNTHLSLLLVCLCSCGPHHFEKIGNIDLPQTIKNLLQFIVE